VKIDRYDEARESWSINHLKRGPIVEIERGELLEIDQQATMQKLLLLSQASRLDALVDGVQ
jgi:hypothetical protein